MLKPKVNLELNLKVFISKFIAFKIKAIAQSSKRVELVVVVGNRGELV